MKNVFYLLLVFCLSFLGIKAADGSSLLSEEEGCYTCLSVGDDNISLEYPVMAAVFSDASEFPFKDMTLSDSKNLARQLRGCNRGQRNGYLNGLGGVCVSAWKKALYHLDELSHSSSNIYTSLPRLGWEYSSDHYIFGMRRILI